MSIDTSDACSRQVLGNRAAETLSEVRVSAGPMKNPPQQFVSPPAIRIQSLLQGRNFSVGKITQLDSLTYVKRRQTRITDEVGWGCHAEQTKSQSLELRILGPPVVTFSNCCEKFIRRKRETANNIDLVHEDHQWLTTFPEHHLANSCRKAKQRVQATLSLPEPLQCDLQAKL